ncbi:MAG TPA: AAA family ATPase [Fimbriimonadaceae bacterium]|nr:AAA family ATPase [Fimbriimonadaceae bacterium]HRJ97449.1 AAA family ATPase [Fimbriimonadaceae bacterium]
MLDDEVRQHLRQRPYNPTVFFFPPWEAIFAQDAERDQTFFDAVRISKSLREGFESLGFRLVDVPPSSPEERADAIIAAVMSQTEP